jgi:hypothetical protein
MMDTSKMPVRHPIGMATEAPQVTGDVVKDVRRDAPMVKANSHVAHERIMEVQETAKDALVTETEMKEVEIPET